MSAAKTSRNFSGSLMVALVVAGVSIFAAYFVLSAFAPELSNTSDGRGHALSRSAIGFAGTVDLLRATGQPVNVSRNTFDPARGKSLVVFTPEWAINRELIDTARGEVTLLVLPKWRTGPHPLRHGWVGRLGLTQPEALQSMIRDLAAITITQRPGAGSVALFQGEVALQAAYIDSLQTINGEDVAAIITDERGGIVLGATTLEDGARLYLLSDPDFLNNQGIAKLETARAGARMLGLLADGRLPVLFDVTMNGLGQARSALRLAFEPPLLGATLALVIAALLLGWRATVRVGPAAHPQRAIAFGKRALADNAAALLRLTGQDKGLAPAFAETMAMTVSRYFGKPRLNPAELDALGDRLGASAPYSDLLREAQSAKTLSQMLVASHKLFNWKQEMLRATR